jgi:hypothetical protein
MKRQRQKGFPRSGGLVSDGTANAVKPTFLNIHTLAANAVDVMYVVSSEETSFDSTNQLLLQESAVLSMVLPNGPFQ